MAVVVFCILVVWYFGSQTNSALTKAVWATVRPVLDAQWASVPTSWESLSDAQQRVFVSGRRYALGAFVELNLRPRSNALSLLTSVLGMSASTDTLTVDIALREEYAQPIVLAALPARQAKKLAEEATDIHALATVVSTNSARLPGGDCINDMKLYTDSADVVAKLLPKASCKLIGKHGSSKLSSGLTKATSLADAERAITFEAPSGLLAMVHWTDLAPLGTGATSGLSRSALRFQFNVPSNGKLVPLLAPLLTWAFQCVDTVAGVRLSSAAAAKNRKARRTLAAEQKADAGESTDRAAELKEERQKARDEEIRRVARSNPELAAKMEAKDAAVTKKRLARKRGKKV